MCDDFQGWMHKSQLRITAGLTVATRCLWTCSTGGLSIRFSDKPQSSWGMQQVSHDTQQCSAPHQVLLIVTNLIKIQINSTQHFKRESMISCLCSTSSAYWTNYILRRLTPLRIWTFCKGWFLSGPISLYAGQHDCHSWHAPGTSNPNLAGTKAPGTSNPNLAGTKAQMGPGHVRKHQSKIPVCKSSSRQNTHSSAFSIRCETSNTLGSWAVWHITV